MNTNDMTVFIIDDDPKIRDSLKLIIELDGLSVEGFSDAKTFLEFYQPELRGCAIIDINMPEMNGLQLQTELNNRGFPLPIIFLTGHGNIPLSVKTIKAGASNFLIKPVSRKTLLDSIKSALKEAETLSAEQEENQRCQLLLGSLTEREKELMPLLIEGLTHKIIAQQLDISHRTVEIHKSNILRKTATKNLLELAQIAIRGEALYPNTKE